MHESSNDISYELQQLSGWPYDGRGGYSLGFLLRKSPEITLKSDWRLPPAMDGSRFHDDTLRWTATYYRVKYTVSISVDADTPEDTACKLAIKLFKQGILERSSDDR